MGFLNVTRSFMLVAALAVAVTAQAQAVYPSKPVRWIIPFPPGGATDVIARMAAQKLTESWGQTVIIDNRAGATGAIGSELVAKAPPDGYTILMGTASTHSVAPAVNPRLPYNNIADFTPVSLVATFPNMLVVHPSVPAKTVAELIALLKANPGKYNFASSGSGSSIHLAGELFKLMTGTQMTHVPYKGSAQALNDLLGGQVQIEFDNMTTVWPHVKAGKLRALGVASLKRTPIAPEVPAIAETVAGFEANSWVGFFAPAKTPAHIVQKIAADTRRVVRLPELTQRLHELGATAVGSSPEEFAAFVRNDTDKWRKVVKDAHIVVD